VILFEHEILHWSYWMNEPKQFAGELPAPLVAALRRVLRPLIRLLLSHGIRFQTFCDLVKSTYIQVAEEEFRLESKAQTDSRISLLTGVHRRDVKRLRSESLAVSSLSLQASLSAQLLAMWSGRSEYLDSQGVPLPLPRLVSKGGEHSFEALVRSVSKDFRARVVLDEWLRQGIATLDEQDNVHLAADAFVSPQGIEEKTFYFGQNIHDHLAAIVHNLSGVTPPFLERCVYYDNLTAESVKEYERVAKSAGMRALHTVNRYAVELQKRDTGQSDAIYRTNFGVYNFSEVDRGDDTLAE
jgi:Family of unknown function (DUF6502)